MTVPDHIVFDAEPLIAHADDEPGSDVVEEYLDAVAVADTVGYAGCVNFAEIRYTIARKYDRDTADEYLNWLTDLGIELVDVGDTWMSKKHVTARVPGDLYGAIEELRAEERLGRAAERHCRDRVTPS